MAKKTEKVPVLIVRKNATLREIHAQARREFTAADLQKFTEMDAGIPMEQMLKELEDIHRQETKKKEASRKKKKKR
jgi:hypothetical protein